MAIVMCMASAVNTAVHIPFQKTYFFPDICPGVGFQDHMVALFFKGIFLLFSIVSAPIYIPTNSVENFPMAFSHLQDKAEVLYLPLKTLYNLVPFYSPIAFSTFCLEFCA